MVRNVLDFEQYNISNMTHFGRASKLTHMHMHKLVSNAYRE